MKHSLAAIAVLSVLGLTACNQETKAPETAGESTPVVFNTPAEKQAYALGASMGAFAVSRKEQLNELDMDIDEAMLRRGFEDGLTKNSQIPLEEMQQIIRNSDQEVRAKQEAMANKAAESNIETGKAFLAENATKEGVIVTESGLQYQVLVEGTGTSPKATDTVRVHYQGTLLDGTEFDSSYKRGEPAEFPLNRVIPGWTEGVQLMKEGAKFKFFIPSELAYGERATGAITPNSTLVFEVELLDVVTAEAPAAE